MAVFALALCLCHATRLAAQEEDERPEVMKAFELENAGKYKEAAVLFRSALRVKPSANAILGLERVYAELGMSDSLLAPLDTIIALQPTRICALTHTAGSHRGLTRGLISGFSGYRAVRAAWDASTGPGAVSASFSARAWAPTS